MDEILSEKMLTELIARGDLEKAKLEQARRNLPADQSLTAFLLDRGWLDKAVYLLYLGEKYKYPIFNPDAFNLAPEILACIPADFATRYQVLPVNLHGNVLTVAIADPANIIVLDDLRSVTKKSISPVIALPHAIQKALEKYYASPEVEEEDSMQDLIKVAMDKKEDEGETGKSDLVRLATETPIIKITNTLLIESIRRRASDLFVEPWDKTMRVRCRVDGQLEELKAPPKSMAEGIVSRIKVMSNLNIAERRLPQDGRFRIKAQERMIDIRVSVLPTSFGEKVCLRILDKTAQTQQLDKLGFQEKEVGQLEFALKKPYGMILITGPTGSGKTSSLYAMLNCLDDPKKNITTVEDPVEYKLDGINQVQVNNYVGLTFAASLRSILRQDPDIIMLGEIRDIETLDIAIKSALTGHLVLSTLHTNDASSSIIRMTNMGIEPFLITSSIIMVSAQRLVRRLCHHCRESCDAPPESLDDLGLNKKNKHTIFKPGSCNLCRHTGFLGRTVITEVLSITPKMSHLILDNGNGDQIKALAREEGMTTLRESGINKVLHGETTLEEVYRVTVRDKETNGTTEQ